MLFFLVLPLYPEGGGGVRNKIEFFIITSADIAQISRIIF
jgi:hypothetical protein